MTHYHRSWNCRSCGKPQQTVDWPKSEDEYCEKCATPDHQGEAVGPNRPTGTIFELGLFRERLARAGRVWKHEEGDSIYGVELSAYATELKALIDSCQAQYHPIPEPPIGEAVGQDRPTGTIFDLDMFRERLEKWAGEIWNEPSPTLETKEVSDAIEEHAAELKTLIDRCQAQYVDRHPVPEPLEDGTPTKGPTR